jgi:mono/diheme cytochrome c family protein
LLDLKYFMKLKVFFSLALLIFCSIVVFNLTDSEEIIVDETVDPEQLFVHEVLPILKEKCFACHGDDPEEIEGAFDIRTLEGMLKGGESGKPALLAGAPHESQAYIAVTWQDGDLEMPPKENDRLTEKQIAMLGQWIAQGAPWPDEVRQQELLANTEWDYADGIQVKTSGALSDQWANRRYKPETLWAFYPVQNPEVPASFLEAGQENPIDAFINRKLSENHIPPAAKADKVTLIRRATFDLTGLPPTPREVADFLADDSPEAFEKVIDRLLASPRYGEQWGRHWLDVVRYADTDGFSNDYERPNAWRYRDYVIRSFNQDKPYDQFIKEQIAGDEINPDDPEMLIAVGYLRMGPWEHTAMSVAAETRQLFLNDVTNSVGETFLSIPLRCASCHDHKFDPIPTKDYYSIQAVFAPVQFASREAPYLPSENLEGFAEGEARLGRLIKETEKEQEIITAKEEAAARAWMKERGLKYVPKRERRKLPESQQPPRYYGLSFQDLGYRKVLQKRMQLVSIQHERYEPLAFSVYNGSLVENPHSGRPMRIPENDANEVQETFILTGGSVYAPAEEVTPSVLSAVQSLTDEPEPVFNDNIPQGAEGRRTAFANWLASPDNPITTRSIVNRIWQYHFGKGLAGNANNFGVMGKKPTHPELLDWLTRHFVEHGWSFKTMHRLIMTSEAYQRSSDHQEMEAVQEVDPDNQWLAYFSPRRLTAEELRDAMLRVSGELNPKMGGFPVYPEINMEVALQPRHIMGSVAPAYQPSPTPQQRNRRTIYTYHYRGLPNPMLEVFNQPNADMSCERRIASTVTPQVFTLLNGNNTYQRSLVMAHRLMQDAPTLLEQVDLAIQRAWNRSPSVKERLSCVVYVQKMKDYHIENPSAVQPYPVEIRRKMFEEMTGEPFEYSERLDIYENYTSDLKPWEVSPETRALADLCLVLFNANEFIYIY